MSMQETVSGRRMMSRSEALFVIGTGLLVFCLDTVFTRHVPIGALAVLLIFVGFHGLSARRIARLEETVRELQAGR